MSQNSQNSNLEIIKKHQLKFGIRFLVWFLMFIFTFIAPLILSIKFLPISSFLLGLVIAHGIELQHQAIHYTGFSLKILNEFAGQLLGFPTLNSFTHYQTLHNWHHQKIGTKDDIEFFQDHRIDITLTPLNLMARIFRVQDTLELIFERLFLKIKLPKNILNLHSDKMIKIQKELIFYRIIYLIFFLLTLTHKITVILFFNWVLALLFYHICHFLFEFPEHYLCPTDKKSIYQNTRSITGNSISRYITNFNNFHVEHHLFPKLPMDYLVQVHKEISSKIENKNNSYFDFYVQFLWRYL
jgi:fatty acid desaturase